MVDVDYSTLSEEQREEALGEAYKAHDYKLMRVIVTASQKAEDAAKKAKKDALQEQLASLTSEVMATIKKAVQKIYDSGKLDDADGIWFAWDFGSTEASCRLTKATPRAPKGDGARKSTYGGNAAKTDDLLSQSGDEVMFADATTRFIDKVEITIPAGTTFKEAYAMSTNGNWRFAIRMALLKKTGLV